MGWVKAETEVNVLLFLPRGFNKVLYKPREWKWSKLRERQNCKRELDKIKKECWKCTGKTQIVLKGLKNKISIAKNLVSEIDDKCVWESLLKCEQ